MQFVTDKKFGSSSTFHNKVVLNLFKYQLFTTGFYVLSRVLEFCIPPLSSKIDNIFAYFEVFFVQISKLSSLSPDKFSVLTAKLNDFTFGAYADTPVDYIESIAIHFRAINFLRRNKSLIKTKTDKGVGVVAMDYDDYANKMMLILGDGDKLIRFGPGEIHNRTKSIDLNF